MRVHPILRSYSTPQSHGAIFWGEKQIFGTFYEDVNDIRGWNDCHLRGGFPSNIPIPFPCFIPIVVGES
jgi:hypothetical protein